MFVKTATMNTHRALNAAWGCVAVWSIGLAKRASRAGGFRE
jgi:hypothetical protein